MLRKIGAPKQTKKKKTRFSPVKTRRLSPQEAHNSGASSLLVVLVETSRLITINIPRNFIFITPQMPVPNFKDWVSRKIHLWIII